MQRISEPGLTLLLLATAFAPGCGTSPAGGGSYSAGEESGSTDEDGEAGEGTDENGTDDGGPTIRLDVGATQDINDDGGEACKVTDDLDAIGPCDETAPPDSFEPEVQWEWTGPDDERHSVTTPLVGNLTDDNDDGEIDLCDTPDVVTIACTHDLLEDAQLYVLDGETGELQFETFYEVNCTATPALGDIDGDGVMEIIAIDTVIDGSDKVGQIIAFENDGTLKWKGALWPEHYIGAVAIADLDNDDSPEIIVGNLVIGADGEEKWTAAEDAPTYPATTAIDLDGDDDLEVILGHAAYHHDGTEYYLNNEVEPGYPQVANFDDDPEPEILLTTHLGFSILEHDGTTKLLNQTPTGDPTGTFLNWHRPAAVHDMNGDGDAEFAQSSRSHYAVYRRDGSILWQADVADESGAAAGTAFDFLGDGGAEAMYGDETFMFIFGASGETLLQTDRASATGIEYPIVADIDNDGSAEIVVTSNSDAGEDWPTVQVIRDKDDRWIQARRIWNQHAYHVTNVREDGTIPAVQKPVWESLNTFRTNAQIEGGNVCEPPG